MTASHPAPHRRRAPGVTVWVVLLLLAGLLVAVVAPTGPATADRVTESSGRPDPRLGRTDCALMGRVRVATGCSRTECVVRGEQVRRSPNAETCLVGGRNGAAYGNEIDSRTCSRLHRRFVPVVNFCASNPHRAQTVTDRAPQCVAPFTTYVVVTRTTGGRATRREAEGRYDACLRPSTVRRLEREAGRTGARLGGLVLELTRGPRPGAEGPTVLVVGDSLTWRATDELARLRPDWVVDGVSGRNLRALGPRLGAFTAVHGEPTGLVVALGTNPARGYDLDDLRAVVDRLAPEVPVVVVTPYRRSRLNPAAQVRAVDRAAEQLRRLVAERPLTCEANWRDLARADPDLLVDGTHQVRAVERRWARLVSTTWTKCESL